MTQFSQEELNRRFTARDVDGDTYSKMASVRMRIKDLAEDLEAFVPDGREKALVMTHLEEAMFWANAGIAREDPDTSQSRFASQDSNRST